MEPYIRFDECLDVLASLEQCARSLDEALQLRQDRAWKWVILSLHSALQGAMVCHLSGRANLGALSKENAKKRLEWIKKDLDGEITKIQDDVDGVPIMRIKKKKDRPPSDYLAKPSELFKKLSLPPSSRMEDAGGIISITKKQEQSFECLNELRNEFSHFSPKGWSIRRSSLGEMINDILDVLCLILDDDWPFRDMLEEDKRALRSRIEEVRLHVTPDPDGRIDKEAALRG